MKTVLVCHEEAPLDREGLARWLASFSDLVGLVVLMESPGRILGQARKEINRVGLLRFLDVLAFRIYYRLFLSGKDSLWEQQILTKLRARYPAIADKTAVLKSLSPNTPEVDKFIRGLSPDLMVARCKMLLKETIFSIPRLGTFVMHPGICPEYRNAHGCFWALSNADLAKVGMTLLRIDKGVDTGPIYGYYAYKFDELRESHVVIQHRVVLENLDTLKEKLIEIERGLAIPI